MKGNLGWAGRFGFYLVAIGAACGLGNLWRFPFVVAENGGGAFVLLYLLLSFVLGVSWQISELILGRFTGKSIFMALSEAWRETWREQKVVPSAKPISKLLQETRVLFYAVRVAAALPVFLALATLTYYSVVSGWVLHFLNHFVLDLSGISAPEVIFLSPADMSGWLQVALASVHVLLVLLVVSKGMQDGVERWIGGIFILFVFLLALLLWRTLQLPTAGAAARFLFYPDFSRLSVHSLGQGIGHVCFTLSVGFGMMVTFGRHMKPQESIPVAAFRVTLLDSALSLLAGMLVFPIALQMNSTPLADPMLLFEALPKFFHEIRGGSFFGLVFFLCLYLSAFGGSVALLEVVVSNLIDLSKWSRSRCSWVVGTFAVLGSIAPALSNSVFRDFDWRGRSLLSFFDFVLTTWALPISVLLTSFVVFFAIPQKALFQYFVAGDSFEAQILFPSWMRILKWLGPALILWGLLVSWV